MLTNVTIKYHAEIENFLNCLYKCKHETRGVIE